MKTILYFPMFCCLLVLAAGFSYGQNPIVQTIYTADPAPFVFKDTLYLYTGHDEDNATWFVMKDWHVYATTDMVNWIDKGSPLSVKTFKWAQKDAWAGQCIHRNGKFYWYVPVDVKGAGMSIGVAVSDSPTGPFEDALGKPLITGGWGYIDPTVFIDDDGLAYLYWGNPHLYYVKLNEDMISYNQATGIVKVPLTDESFKLRIINAKNTFHWAEFIDGTASHSIKGSDNKYYWYVSAVEKDTHKKVIGVAKGDQANGPFTDVLGKPLITAHCEEENNNPTVIVDNDKQSWLTWGKKILWRVKLNADLMSFNQDSGIQRVPSDKLEWFASKIKGTVNTTEKRATTYEEGPWLYKRNKLYYLFYPAGGVPEHLAYSTAPTAAGPWTYGDTVMAVIPKGGAFTNHPGVVDYKGKTYLFYHNGSLPGGGGFARSVCVDELHFTSDNRVLRVQPTSGLANGVGVLNPFVKQEAETIAWEKGIKTKEGKSGVFVTNINNGDYLKVRNVEFKRGAKTFNANIAGGKKGASIELHLDSLAGPLIGTCKINNKGEEQVWTTITSAVKNAKGLHDLYFVFKGDGAELFQFDWWKFSR